MSKTSFYILYSYTTEAKRSRRLSSTDGSTSGERDASTSLAALRPRDHTRRRAPSRPVPSPSVAHHPTIDQLRLALRPQRRGNQGHRVAAHEQVPHGPFGGLSRGREVDRERVRRGRSGRRARTAQNLTKHELAVGWFSHRPADRAVPGKGDGERGGERGDASGAATWRPRRRRTLMISSYVSSSISTVVITSSTSPRIMFRCWSYACGRTAETGGRFRRATLGSSAPWLTCIERHRRSRTMAGWPPDGRRENHATDGRRHEGCRRLGLERNAGRAGGCATEGRRWQATRATYVQLSSDLALAPELDVDALVQGEPDQVEGLLHRGVFLRHRRERSAAGVTHSGPSVEVGVWRRRAKTLLVTRGFGERNGDEHLVNSLLNTRTTYRCERLHHE